MVAPKPIDCGESSYAALGEDGQYCARSTEDMASRTRGALMRPWVKRFWISSAFVRPEQRQAIVAEGTGINMCMDISRT